MNFKEKIKAAIYKIKVRLIVGAFLLLSVLIFAGSTFSVAIGNGRLQADESGYNWTVFYETIFNNTLSPIKSLKLCFTPDYFPDFLNLTGIFILIYFLVALIGFFKAIPKHQYDDIEHGSSRWADGDEYGILSRKAGIILAEKHYLPVDKRGNVNVLVVRRFWCW